MSYTDELAGVVRGEVDTSSEALVRASRDASIFEVRPHAVVSPRDVDDVKKLVLYATEHPGISLTARSAGTDMSGGPLSDSIVVEFTTHFSRVKEVGDGYAVTEPGVYYRDFDKATLEKGGQIMPSYPASRELCTVGGMVANNAGGEKTLTYGKTERYVRRLKMVCADGNEYEFKPLTLPQLEEKKKLTTFEGEMYRRMHNLIDTNADLIKRARPLVSKNSCGYYLWNVMAGCEGWTTPVGSEHAHGPTSSSADSHQCTFDLTKMIVGSQGTLGLITEIEFALVKPKQHSHLLVVFLHNLDDLGIVATRILEHKPESFESYDDKTLKVALKFLPTLIEQMKGNIITLGLQFVPEMLAVLEGGMPKLVLMAEFSGDSDEEALHKAQTAHHDIKDLHETSRVTKTARDARKYWVIRRESFNMLRKHVHGLRTAPFIDDFVVQPKSLPEFLPKLYAILDNYKGELVYTIAGHVGDGNFHIIPLMDLSTERAHEIIRDLSVKVYELVHEYKGSITGEHNDGIIRTPFVKMQYGDDVYKLFEETKNIWDPKNIFNPRKKVGGTLEYAFTHIVK